jgi:hypothetical protein
MAGRRKFSKAFESQVVKEFLAGEVRHAVGIPHQSRR